jgi:ATPase subunit of ABC transporter with duplicated ATPase domains
MHRSKDFVNNPNDGIYQLVNEGLRYLDMRTDFWRQQKPLYARKKEQSRIQAKVNNAKTRQGAAKQKKKAEHDQQQRQPAQHSEMGHATANDKVITVSSTTAAMTKAKPPQGLSAIP